MLGTQTDQWNLLPSARVPGAWLVFSGQQTSLKGFPLLFASEMPFSKLCLLEAPLSILPRGASGGVNANKGQEGPPWAGGMIWDHTQPQDCYSEDEIRVKSASYRNVERGPWVNEYLMSFGNTPVFF